MVDSTFSETFDSDLAGLLTELSDVQRDLLAVLGQKRDCLAAADLVGLAELQPREELLVERLQQCQHRRASLLSEAASQGRQHASLSQLAAAMPATKRRRLQPQLQEAMARSRLLQHQSLTNWVLVQRTLIHLSQMLEIIATGGRPRPTYGKGDTPDTSGNLVDQEA